MHPALGELTGQVEPDRGVARPVDRTGSHQIHRVQVGVELLPRPVEHRDDQLRAENPGTVDPLLVAAIQAADEFRVARRLGQDAGPIVVTLARQPAQVDVNQMQGDVLDRPRGRGGSGRPLLRPK